MYMLLVYYKEHLIIINYTVNVCYLYNLYRYRYIFISNCTFSVCIETFRIGIILMLLFYEIKGIQNSVS